MSRSKGILPVIYDDDALRELDEIYDWNAESYSRSHAKSYIDFLTRHIDALSKNYRKGKPVSTRPDLSYIRIQRRSKRHGHIAVYVHDEQEVTVLHIFHTARD